METRTISEIKEEIAGNYRFLSNVSILKHVQDVIAIATWYLSNLFTFHKEEVNEIVSHAKSATISWYENEISKFQVGYQVALIDYIPQYPILDEDARIVFYINISENLPNGGIMVKIAKEDRNVLFTSSELEALKAYINKIKYPGTPVFLINQLSDLANIDMDVVVDPQMINLEGRATGTNNYVISDKIDDYFDNHKFGSLFYLDIFLDEIKTIPGVVSIKLNHIDFETFTGVNHTVFDLASGINEIQYSPEAGHIAKNTLNYTIIPNV